MTEYLPSEAFQLPTVREFFRTVVRSLENRRSVLVLLPAPIDVDDVSFNLRSELWQKAIEVRELHLDAACNNCAPVAVLSRFLEIEWEPPETPRTVYHLVEQLTRSGTAPDVIEIRSIDVLDDKSRAEWVELLVQWAEITKEISNTGQRAPAFCLIIPARDVLNELPSSDLHLALHWWWGFPSALELGLLCRLRAGNVAGNAASPWKENLLPSLAGNDFMLFELLWDAPARFESIFDGISEHYAQLSGWTGDRLTQWGANRVFQATDRRKMTDEPAAEFLELWAHGALSWTPEYGLELHTMALHLLGWREKLDHRIWRGQAAFLLPMLDQLRITICEDLTVRYGPDWPTQWGVPLSDEEIEAVTRTPFACQWGHLQYLLTTSEELRPNRNRWLGLTTLSRKIRNKLAHYQAIPFQEYEALFTEIRRTELSWAR